MRSFVFKRAFKVISTQILKKAVCLQSLSRKDGEALQKFLEFDTRVNIVCRLIVKCIFDCFAAKRRLIVHIKLVLLLSTSMAGSLVMGRTLQQVRYQKIYQLLFQVASIPVSRHNTDATSVTDSILEIYSFTGPLDNDIIVLINGNS